MSQLAADMITIADTPAVLVIAFANTRTGSYVQLQMPLAPTAQDARLGHDVVHLERNDQLWSAYGGLDRITLLPDRVRLELDARSAKLMGSDQALEIAFTKEGWDRATLRAALQRCVPPGALVDEGDR